MAQMNAQTIKVTSNGTKPVKVTLDKAAVAPATPDANVVYSTDMKTITIAAGYRTEVTISSSNEATSITVSGNLDNLDIDAPKVTRLTFDKENLVTKLTLKAPE